MAFGQEAAELPGKSRVYMSPWSFLANTFQLLYERDYSKGSFLLAGDALVIRNKDEETLGFGAEIQPRITVYSQNVTSTKRGKTSSYHAYIYGAPYLRYRYIDATYTKDSMMYDIWGTLIGTITTRETDIISSFSGGVVLGVRFTFVKKLSLDLFAGGGVKFSDINGNKNRYGQVFDYGYTGILPKGGMKLGLVL